MRVLHVTPECYPMVKTGGLGDVSAALPAALIEIGVDARLLLPGYPAVLDGLAATRRSRRPLGGLPGGGAARLIEGRTPDGVPVYAIEAPELYGRSGNPYGDDDGRDWPDNHRRFATLGRVAAGFAERRGSAWRPDVIHGHDWQAGLAPAYLALKGAPRPASVMTIHNIAYQGLFPAAVLGELGLPPESFAVHGVEYYGQVGFLKAGLYYADRLTTVSPTYAVEIRSGEDGCGLQGLLATRAADLVGILNGIDTRVWNPATDAALAATYDARTLDAKAANKTALQAEFGLERRADALLLAMISRLTPQKGVDLVLAAVPHILEQGGQLVVLGAGDRPLEEGLSAAAASHPGRIGVRIGYDERLSHRIQAGADAILVPSRFEPCGLVQLYGLRYGTLPIVRRAGGLADTVEDASAAALAEGRATGFVFAAPTLEALSAALARALALYRDRQRWRRVQRVAMARDFGWVQSAQRYRALYQALRPGR